PNLAPEFARRNVNLFGLSRQTSDYQREMTTRLNIPFPILSDTEGPCRALLPCLASQLVARNI
ncbi:MAG: hypothetical protein WBE89_14805, partial [Methyloceanibacter sp.]